jgi:hypothetical protein
MMNMLSGLMAQLEGGGPNGPGGEQAKALSEKLQSVYKTALKFSMRKKMGQ